MADATAKREARRRRILQNSENRLQKITGKIVDENITNNRSTIEDDLERESRLPDLANGPSTLHKVPNNNEMDYNEHNGLMNTTNFLNHSVPIQSESLIWYYLLTSRFCYVLLAALVNVALLCDMDYIYGKAVTIPCFTIMSCRLCISGSYRKMGDNSLLFAALILCNVKPILIYRIRIIVNMFSIFFKELSLYIFSFLIMYHGISSFDKFNSTFGVRK